MSTEKLQDTVNKTHIGPMTKLYDNFSDTKPQVLHNAIKASISVSITVFSEPGSDGSNGLLLLNYFVTV